MKNKQKLSPKESVIKGLETRQKNLQKKQSALIAKFNADRKEILADLQVVNIQLQALRKK